MSGTKFAVFVAFLVIFTSSVFSQTETEGVRDSVSSASFTEKIKPIDFSLLSLRTQDTGKPKLKLKEERKNEQIIKLRVPAFQGNGKYEGRIDFDSSDFRGEAIGQISFDALVDVRLGNYITYVFLSFGVNTVKLFEGTAGFHLWLKRESGKEKVSLDVGLIQTQLSEVARPWVTDPYWHLETPATQKIKRQAPGGRMKLDIIKNLTFSIGGYLFGNHKARFELGLNWKDVFKAGVSYNEKKFGGAVSFKIKLFETSLYYDKDSLMTGYLWVRTPVVDPFIWAVYNRETKETYKELGIRRIFGIPLFTKTDVTYIVLEAAYDFKNGVRGMFGISVTRWKFGEGEVDEPKKKRQ